MGSSSMLSGLRTFLAVGRAGSMVGAARLLNVTEGAVSQAVQSLEDHLQTRLTERSGRTIALTPAGRTLFDATEPALTTIERALSEARQSASMGRQVFITTTPSFAATILAPRLASLQSVVPNWQVEIDAAIAIKEPTDRGCFLAIRHGSGRYPGFEVWPLWSPKLIVVAAPALAHRLGEHPADWGRAPFLHDRDRRHWDILREAYRLPFHPESTTGPSFENDLLLIEAAASGAGIALVRDLYAARSLSAGRLVRLGKLELQTDTAYFLVADPKRHQRSLIEPVLGWLQEEMQNVRSSIEACSPSIKTSPEQLSTR